MKLDPGIRAIHISPIIIQFFFYVDFFSQNIEEVPTLRHTKRNKNGRP